MTTRSQPLAIDCSRIDGAQCEFIAGELGNMGISAFLVGAGGTYRTCSVTATR